MRVIKCHYCKEPNWIEASIEVEHIQQFHREQIQDAILYTIETTSEQVDYLYRRFKMPLINGEGWLIQKTLQYFPFKGTRAVYNQGTGDCELIAPIGIFADVCKHVGTISRLGRAWRMQNKELIEEWRRAEADQKEAERRVQYGLSVEYWREAGNLTG